MSSISKKDEQLAESLSSKGKLVLALETAGDSGLYQKVIVGCMTVLYLTVSLCLIGSTLLFQNPQFFCEGSEGMLLSQKQACNLMTTTSTKCHVSEEFTITNEASLYCEKKSERTTIQILYAVGAAIGMPIINLLGDIKGRKMALLMSCLISIIGSALLFVGGLMKLIGLLYFGQILLGIGSFSAMSLIYVITSDFCGDVLRQKSYVLFAVNYAVGMFIQSALFHFEINWKVFLFGFLFAPLCIIMVFMWSYLYESPYILMEKNMKQKCIEVLIQISEINSKDSEQTSLKIKDIVQSYSFKSKQQEVSLQYIWKLTKQPKYLVPLICLSICLTMRDANSSGLNYAASNIGYGYDVNFLVSGLVQLLSISTLSLFIDRIPRKKSAILFFLMTTVCQVSFFMPWVLNSKPIVTVLLGISRICSGVGYVLIGCLRTECFPVQIQSSTTGTINWVSLFGFILGPWIVSFGIEHELNLVGVIGITSISLSLSILCINEKAHSKSKGGDDQIDCSDQNEK